MHGEPRNLVIRTLDKREFTLEAGDQTPIPELKDAVALKTFISSDSQVTLILRKIRSWDS
jgi:hypothetical protein